MLCLIKCSPECYVETPRQKRDEIQEETANKQVRQAIEGQYKSIHSSRVTEHDWRRPKPVAKIFSKAQAFIQEGQIRTQAKKLTSKP